MLGDAKPERILEMPLLNGSIQGLASGHAVLGDAVEKSLIFKIIVYSVPKWNLIRFHMSLN